MKKTISYSDTNLMANCIVKSIDRKEIQIENKELDGFTKFYKVTLHFNDRVILYLAKGYEDAPREVVAFYTNGVMWGSYGKNFAEAIRGAHEDAIYCMKQ
tara:strand:+ start:8120 stop:8419 length:300 start_codon:yes stop_codon:yes gene_type:complete